MKALWAWIVGLFTPEPTIEELRAALTDEERKAVDHLVMDVWLRHPIHLLPSEEKRRWYTKEFAADAIRLRKLQEDARDRSEQMRILRRARP